MFVVFQISQVASCFMGLFGFLMLQFDQKIKDRFFLAGGMACFEHLKRNKMGRVVWYCGSAWKMQPMNYEWPRVIILHKRYSPPHATTIISLYVRVSHDLK